MSSVAAESGVRGASASKTRRTFTFSGQQRGRIYGSERIGSSLEDSGEFLDVGSWQYKLLGSDVGMHEFWHGRGGSRQVRNVASRE